jgi:hypothetical protein
MIFVNIVFLLKLYVPYPATLPNELKIFSYFYIFTEPFCDPSSELVFNRY